MRGPLQLRHLEAFPAEQSWVTRVDGHAQVLEGECFAVHHDPGEVGKDERVVGDELVGVTLQEKDPPSNAAVRAAIRSTIACWPLDGTGFQVSACMARTTPLEEDRTPRRHRTSRRPGDCGGDTKTVRTAGSDRRCGSWFRS